MPGRGRAWTEDDIAYLRENWSAKTDVELAEHLGRTKSAIVGTRQRLGLTSKESSNRKSSWTPEEIEELQELWGSRTIPQIAAKLGRSSHAVKVKSTRLGLGRFVDSSEYLTANQVATVMHVDIHAVTDSWIPSGLPFKWKSPAGKRKFRHIKFDALLRWLRENQDKWDSRRVELFALGQEPDWLGAKREKDATLPTRKAQKWTQEEDAGLVAMFRRGDKTNAEMGAELGRSAVSCEHRISRLDVWGTGKFIGEVNRERRKAKKEESERSMLIVRLRNVLLAKRNAMDFGEYWQKDLCQNWNDIRGCMKNCTDCDSCTEFQRIRPQHCVRCGVTFIERSPSKFCRKCREARKQQYQRKWSALHGRRAAQKGA